MVEPLLVVEPLLDDELVVLPDELVEIKAHVIDESPTLHPAPLQHANCPVKHFTVPFAQIEVFPALHEGD